MQPVLGGQKQWETGPRTEASSILEEKGFLTLARVPPVSGLCGGSDFRGMGSASDVHMHCLLSTLFAKSCPGPRTDASCDWSTCCPQGQLLTGHKQDSRITSTKGSCPTWDDPSFPGSHPLTGEFERVDLVSLLSLGHLQGTTGLSELPIGQAEASVSQPHPSPTSASAQRRRYTIT